MIAPRQLPLPGLSCYDQAFLWNKKTSSLRSFPMIAGCPEAEVLLCRDTDRSLYRDPEREAMGLPPPLQLYAGVSDPAWNRWPTLAGPYACVSPVHGQGKNQSESVVALNPKTSVILDSGAFSDMSGQKNLLGQPVAFHHRLSFEEALNRQYSHMHKYRYEGKVEALATYDVLIGEHIETSAETSAQWQPEEVLFAIEETIRAAAFLDAHRNGRGCVMTVQGQTPEQYLFCTEQILPYVRDGDMIGLGGWGGIGRSPKQLLPVFRATIRTVLPMLARAGIKRIHLWGVCHAQALGELLWLADREKIQISTDSAMPALRPSFADWGYAEWHDRGYRQWMPPLHLQEALQGKVELLFDEADDEVMSWHDHLTHDEVKRDGLPAHMRWMLDETLVASYWQQVLASERSQRPLVYDQVQAYDGSWVYVIRARGAHQIEHVYQVRSWLANLHRTDWYRAPYNA